MLSMNELKENIRITRELLINIIEIKENPLDPEIVSMGELLDRLLDEYIRLNGSVEV